jgi:hypothetical protein
MELRFDQAAQRIFYLVMPRYGCFRAALGVYIDVMVGAAAIQETAFMNQLPYEFLSLQLANSRRILDAVGGIKLTSSAPMTI